MDATRARAVIAAEWEVAGELLADLSEGDLDRPTRCRGWDVRDLVGHVLWGTSMEAEALERATARDTTPAAGDVPGDVRAATLAPRFRAGRERLLTALDVLLADVAAVGDADERAVPLQAAPVPLPVALDIFLMEAGAHTDDLRAALGGGSELAPEVAAATIRVLGPYLPLAAGAAERAPDGPVEARLVAPSGTLTYRYDGDAWALVDGGPGPEASVTIAGTDAAIALLLLGRTDATDDHRFQVTGDAELADHLGAWLPGP